MGEEGFDCGGIGVTVAGKAHSLDWGDEFGEAGEGVGEGGDGAAEGGGEDDGVEESAVGEDEEDAGGGEGGRRGRRGMYYDVDAEETDEGEGEMNGEERAGEAENG